MSHILDIATVVLAGLIIYFSYRKGFIRSAIELVGYIASFIAAGVLSSPFGGWIYDNILKKFVYNRFSAYLSQTIGNGKNAGNRNQIIQNLFSGYNLDTNSITSALGSGANIAGNAIYNTVVAPVVMGIARGIAFLAVFILCLIAVRIFADFSDVIFRIPIVGGINQIGGAAIGVLKAAILLFVLSTALEIAVPLFSLQKNPPVTNTIIDNTIVYKYIYNYNPLGKILLKR